MDCLDFSNSWNFKFLEFSNSWNSQIQKQDNIETTLYKKEKLAQVCADFINFNKQLFGIPVT